MCDGSEQTRSTNELPPDSSYTSSYNYIPEMSKQDDLNKLTSEKNSQKKKATENCNITQSVSNEKYTKCDKENIKTISEDSKIENTSFDDRYTVSSKHSDSGYDTLQTGGILPADPEVSDLLRFRFDKKRNPNSVVAYPVHTKTIKNNNSDDNESWGSKIDESRLIKVFSYQYIKSGKDDIKVNEEEIKTSKVSLTKRLETPPQNIVQNRIKVFETNKEEENKRKESKLKMQEPLKMSPPMYQPNEAYVSSLRALGNSNENIDVLTKEKEEATNIQKSKRSSLHGFALGDAVSMLDEEANHAKKEVLSVSKNPKSVRDLLADFERKSQLAKEQLAAEERSNQESPGKRCVFSDTETLLYDTSSDVEGNSDGAIISVHHHPEIIVSDDKNTNGNEEEDRDEEVAAVLGERDTFFSSCRDLGRNQESDLRKKNTSKSSLAGESNDVEVIMTPGYLRLSMAESMVTHEDSESHSSSPHPNPSQEAAKPNLNSDESKNSDSNSPEEHYMPMTPSKKSVLAPSNDGFHVRSNSASQTLIMENLLGEESSYVEMTQDGMIHSLLAPESNPSSFLSKQDLQRLNSTDSNPDTPKYCEIGKGSTHYEFLYRASTHPEPVYMEVGSLQDDKKMNDLESKESVKESSEQSQDSIFKRDVEGAEQPPTPPRTILPDILNSSSNPSQKQASVKSDSSDADDEASKDLDSLDAPRHPRFSLSDTFRPASYYLGASISERTLIGLASEHQDSSDSDLVSPPPIPTSPPPLDDLETSLESSIDMKKLSPVQMKHDNKCDNDKDTGRNLWNPSPLHGKDLRTIHDRMERLIISPSLDDPLSSETDSVESNKRDRLLKRRPVSADILNSLRDPEFLQSSPSSGRRSRGSDLDSIGSRNGLAVDLEEGECIDFDQYLGDLQGGTQLSSAKTLKEFNYGCYGLYQKDRYNLNDAASPCFVPKPSTAGIVRPFIPDEHANITNSTNYGINYISDHIHQIQNKPQPYGTHSGDEVHYENLQGLFPPPPPLPPPPEEVTEQISSPSNTQSEVHIVTSDTSRTTDRQVSALRSEHEYSQQAGAPYYYSDLLKVDDSITMVANRVVAQPRATRIQTLNNQRQDLRDSREEVNFLNKRNDIGRRVNAIHQMSSSDPTSDMNEAARLAEELRTTSAHFLGSANKCGRFDERNLYEADTLQRRKAVALMEQRSQSQTPDLRSSSTRNLYPHGLRDKTDTATSSLSRNSQQPESQQPRRRSRSLEGLLDESEFFRSPEQRQNRVSPGNAISRLLQTTQQSQTARSAGASVQNISSPQPPSRAREPPPPPDVWEEDSLWRESLRRVSLRHTRSLDDLDRPPTNASNHSVNNNKKKKQMTQEATYVNDSITRPRSNQREYEEDYREGRPVSRTTRSSNVGTAIEENQIDDGVHYERLVRDTEILERTRRGQTYLEGYIWDEEREMFHRGEKSAQPMRDPPRKPSQPFLEVGLYPTRPPSFEIDREKLRQWDLMSSAPAGMLGAGRTPGGAPAPLHKKPPATLSHAEETAGSTIVNPRENTPPSSPASGSGSVIGRDPLPPRHPPPAPVVDKPPPPTRSPTQQVPVQPSLAISVPTSAMPTSTVPNNDIHHKRARLAELETPKRLEHLQKLEELKRHLLELEKQYEKGKPLVNLVDNMVKLGSLYRAGAPVQGSSVPLFRERLEFNHKVQEQRLLAEERRDWERLSPDHNQLQAKVEQLYRLDRLLQEESGTLQSLQQDKEMLERAIGGLRHKLQGIHGNPVEAERYRRQQRLLERELSRVRSILAHNSKKLEETVAENARLEQELVVLRQKLQWSRRVPDSGSGPTTAALEAELKRVQTLVGDLQRQRQELSLQVRQLTEKSHSLSEQIRPGPTGVAGAGPIPGKKSIASSWLETDLDTQVTRDFGLDSPAKSPPENDQSQSPQSPSNAPLYVNADDTKNMDVCSTYEGSVSQDEQAESTSAPPLTQYCRPMDISEADDRIKRFYGIIPRDKPQEIKTVRIVKRESERRQRDRDRSGNIGIPLTNTTTAKRVTIIEENVSCGSDQSNERQVLGKVVEEPPEPPSEVFQGSAPLSRPLGPPPAPGPRSDSVAVLRNIVNRQKARAESESSSPSSRSVSAHEQLFGSCASLGSEGEGTTSPQLSPVYQSQAARQIVEEISWRSGGKRLVPREKRRHHTVSGRPLLRIDTSFSPVGGSRDDLDMERALRPRLNAPDVVRSTLSRTDAKYTTDTIDNLLGTPGKIVIPERYVPESAPELTSEEQAKRLKKAEAIRKMLSETTSIPPDSSEVEEEEKSTTLRKKVAEEKRQREHLLQLNQILAQQVMEKSKIVAVRALATLPLETANIEDEEDLSSPEEPLPLYQQRENYFS